ncbi:MAG: Lrp/AsnC family transcriptional regulator [Planctomycetota bacterium]
MDRIDYAILDELQKNARLNNKELAAKVHLAASSCLERVKRLQANGVLQGFHARVDPQALGIGIQAMIQVRLARHSRNQVVSLTEHILQLPETVGFFHLAGDFDFLVHVAVRDANHLRDLALDAFTTREEVAQIQTALLFGVEQKAVWPNLVVPVEAG